jgi:glycosyltransferase involved in cell wall biosynthesis
MRAKVDVDTIAAVARSVDAFVEPWCASVEQGIDARRLLLMASSGVPVIVADGAPGGSVIEHERNGFVVDDGSAAQWARMLSDVFALPPLQRQFLGEEFTRNTFESAPLSAVKAAYYVRFDELLGRYSIPAELRAA